jgi:hypothetical protein
MSTQLTSLYRRPSRSSADDYRRKNSDFRPTSKKNQMQILVTDRG